MWEACGERWAIVEDVFGVVLGASQLGIEGFNVGPIVKDLLLVPWEGEVLALADVVHGGLARTEARVFFAEQEWRQRSFEK